MLHQAGLLLDSGLSWVGEDCVYEGRLEEDPRSVVMVDGCTGEEGGRVLTMATDAEIFRSSTYRSASCKTLCLSLRGFWLWAS